MHNSILFLAVLAVFFVGSSASVKAMQQPVVLELFTSQGCSSCPPADALLKQLSTEDPSLIPLSFHVHYWDYLGWKDPFSSTQNTDRQKAYAGTIGQGQIFTPQLIVDGSISTIGSREDEVRQAITSARQVAPIINLSIMADKSDGRLVATLTPKDGMGSQDNADVWEVYFRHYSKTSVSNGENGGRTLESINNVTGIKWLGTWKQADKNHTIPLSGEIDDGLAIIVQAPHQGRILGAGIYMKPNATH